VFSVSNSYGSISDINWEQVATARIRKDERLGLDRHVRDDGRLACGEGDVTKRKVVRIEPAKRGRAHAHCFLIDSIHGAVPCEEAAVYCCHEA
jgi:hypothetical protein